MRPVLTYEIVRPAAWDVGNRSMRTGGWTIWNRDDYNAMVAEFDRLWPEPENK